MTSNAQTTPSPQQIAQAFLTPLRAQPDRTFDFLSGGRLDEVETPVGRVATARAGIGPRVLLVHGWNGHSSDLAAFAQPLITAGHEVIAMDLPAHGQSQGTTTSIPSGAQALMAVQAHYGELAAVIAHSLGAAMTIQAMGNGMRVARAVLLSAPARYARYAVQFAIQAGLDAEQAQEVIPALRREGLDLPSISAVEVAGRLTQPALLCHSDDDRAVAVEDSVEIAKAWSGARLARFPGLGHRRILQSPEVLEKVLAFIGGQHLD